MEEIQIAEQKVKEEQKQLEYLLFNRNINNTNHISLSDLKENILSNISILT